MATYDVDLLAPEEREFAAYLGIISRPFVRSYKSTGIITRARDVIMSVGVLQQTWEVKGVDVSYWQGDLINPEKMAANADFLIIRAGYGNDYVDPQMDMWRRFCSDYNKSYCLYWYMKPEKDWLKHAVSFFGVWSAGSGNMYPVFDIEETGGLAKSALASWLNHSYVRFRELAHLNRWDKVATYTSPGFLNSAIGLTDWMKLTHLDDAHWTTAATPIIPNEWSVPGLTWGFWQHSCTGLGTDYGVSSRYIDLQRYNGTAIQFNAEFNASVQPPVPEKNTLVMYVKPTSTPYLNVRSGPGANYAVVGRLYPNKEFEAKNVGGVGAWVQIAEGQYKDQWVCVQMNATRFIEPMK